tara:strand:- start:5654 stop:5773 length:120 start_codon:yes stop_codon:yes gene_type:complete
VIALAAAVQLRQTNLELEELLFLYEVLVKTIEEYEREVH